MGSFVVFCGPNASGKTNVLEGISLLATANSFRRSQISQLIRNEASHARLKMVATDGDRQRETVLVLEPGKKRFQVNGKSKSPSEVRGALPSVSFIPDDLELAKKSSSVKRDALDALGIQLSRNYDTVRRDFEKALRYKNSLLKDDAPPAMIDAINDTLLTVATQLYCYRRALYERFIVMVEKRYELLSQAGERFHATYTPSWLRLQKRFPQLSSFTAKSAEEYGKSEVRAYLEEALRCFGNEEIRARRSFVGPHYDEITLFLDGNDSSHFASQGQQRSIVLAWKLAEVQMVKDTLGVSPVLLLDDVMSELDATRRDMLVRAVGDEIQTFVTTTDLTPFNADLLKKAQIIYT